MKVYEKPIIIIEEYKPSNPVSTCEPTTFVPPIDVHCAIKSGDQQQVFDVDYTGEVPEGYSKCKTDNSAISLVVLGKSDENDTSYTTYAYWYAAKDGNPDKGSYDSNTGEGTGKALMSALESAHVSGGSGNAVLHAGPASPQLISMINHS